MYTSHGCQKFYVAGGWGTGLHGKKGTAPHPEAAWMESFCTVLAKVRDL